MNVLTSTLECSTLISALHSNVVLAHTKGVIPIKISSEALNTLLHHDFNTEHESGGILGCNFSGTISNIIFDKIANRDTCPCSYSPNTNYLNKCIADWENQGVAFAGIFHTHIGNSTVLSDGDGEYIKDIICCMPEYIDHLYFPVLSLPEKTITCYLATRTKNEITIVNDELTII